jgi:hypothetical protein
MRKSQEFSSPERRIGGNFRAILGQDLHGFIQGNKEI